jgi:hypothetical protein
MLSDFLSFFVVAAANPVGQNSHPNNNNAIVGENC